MNNKVVDHGKINYAASGTVTSGKVVELTNRIGIPVKGGASGDIIPLEVEGVFSYTKVTADNMALDAKIYYDATEDEMTLDSGEKYAGLCVEAAGSGVSTVKVDINKGAHS